MNAGHDHRQPTYSPELNMFSSTHPALSGWSYEPVSLAAFMTAGLAHVAVVTALAS
jgi:hypothetical protein